MPGTFTWRGEKIINFSWNFKEPAAPLQLRWITVCRTVYVSDLDDPDYPLEFFHRILVQHIENPLDGFGRVALGPVVHICVQGLAFCKATVN